MLDDHSRYVLACTAHTPVTGQDVATTFRAVVDTHGIPVIDALRQRNGVHHQASATAATASNQNSVTSASTQKNGRPYHPQTYGKGV